MRPRLAVLGLGIAVLVAATLWWRETRSTAAVAGPSISPHGSTVRTREVARSDGGGISAGVSYSRDPFRFADEPTASSFSPPKTDNLPSLSASPTPLPVVWIGWIRRGGSLRVALRIAGEVVVMEPGDAREGYQVLALDEDTGVRLRDPQGREFTLPPPD